MNSEYLIRKSQKVADYVTDFKSAMIVFINDSNVPLKERYKTWLEIDDIFKDHSVWIPDYHGRACEPFFESWNEYLQKYDIIHVSDRVSEFYDASNGEINFEYIFDNIFDFGGETMLSLMTSLGEGII